MRDCRFKTMCTDDKFIGYTKKKAFALVETSFAMKENERNIHKSNA